MILSKAFILFFLLGTLTHCTDTSHERSEKEGTESDDSECRFEDGPHSATVDYYNPETGYSQEYTLDVEVENYEVVQISFPNGGWLDNDHITPEELDKDGFCVIEGEDGKTYKIQVDN
ncbi:hypothetical protein [Agriterribacter sp.]|uniref:hypothetical protein n=1 Tax=Agriterribacter sp. TaxID=2821509 RepID=UPI002D14E5E7|nr:hypothetical protein [Agriterribacter sp.]HRO45951.1 hypothetical protein [Agriterribacter sp.]HRQ19403.1 hypothetical protein [Agriterribacter sp.]